MWCTSLWPTLPIAPLGVCLDLSLAIGLEATLVDREGHRHCLACHLLQRQSLQA